MSAIVFLVVCGFYFPLFKKSSLKTLLSLYCKVIALAHLALWTSSTLWTLFTMTYSYANITDLSVYLMLAAAVTYYQLKFLASPGVSGAFFYCVTHLDRLLESLQVSVPLARNSTECFVHLNVNLAVLTVYIYEVFYCENVFSDSSDVWEVCKFVGAFVAYVTFSALATYCHFMINITLQRVRVVRSAVEAFNARCKRKLAWCESTVVARYDTIHLSELYDSFNATIRICGCIYESFNHLRELCTTLFYVQVLSIIMWYPAVIAFNAADNNKRSFVLSNSACLLLNLRVLYMCNAITSEFIKLQVPLTSLYYKWHLRNMTNGTKRLLIQYSRRDKSFDYGLFVIGSAVLPIYYDFMSLIFFALWKVPD